MLRVRFRYVGQGDCIILEGGDDMVPLGVIDCNADAPGAQSNAVTYLEAKAPPALKFVLLTHPHRDHYSGLPAILEYCERTGTPIELFAHSCAEVPEFLQAAAKTPLDERGLTALFLQVYRMRRSGVITEVSSVNSRSRHIDLDGIHRLTFLAPSDAELYSYRRRAYRDGLEAVRKTDANVLSVVTAVEAEDRYILLTSDTERRVLLNIESKLQDRHLSAGQVPHHGSKYNHHQKFWIRRNEEDVSQPLTISVGPNDHGHPDSKVVGDLNRIGFDITLTWMPPMEPRTAVSSALDVVSKEVPAGPPAGSDVVLECVAGKATVKASPFTFPARTL